MMILATALVLSGLALGAYTRWDRRPSPNAFPRWDADTIERLAAGGWAEVFQADQPLRLVDHDPAWVPIFGQPVIDPAYHAATGDQVWEDHGGGDDYAFRLSGDPMGSVEMTADVWWSGDWNSVGLLGVVQPDPPHRMYEAALWHGKLSLIYFYGPTADDWELLAESEPLGIGPGLYRIILRTRRVHDRWALRAQLINLRTGAGIARIDATDNHLPATGYQGFGILAANNPSLISGIAVRALPE